MSVKATYFNKMSELYDVVKDCKITMIVSYYFVYYVRRSQKF